MKRTRWFFGAFTSEYNPESSFEPREATGIETPTDADCDFMLDGAFVPAKAFATAQPQSEYPRDTAWGRWRVTVEFIPEFHPWAAKGELK